MLYTKTFAPTHSFGFDDIFGQDPTLSDALDDEDQMILTIPAFARA